MDHVMKLERRLEHESRLFDKLLSAARTGDEITLSDFNLDGEEIDPQDVHSQHGRFVVELKEVEVSPSNEFFIPNRYYLLSQDLGSAVDCGLHDGVSMIFPSASGIFWCDRKAEGIFFSGAPSQVVTVYDQFLEASYRPYPESSQDPEDRRIRLKRDIWQVDSQGTVYLKTLTGFIRIRTENGMPIEKTELLGDLAERQDFKTFEWGAYGNSLWIHLKEGFVHIESEGKESRINLPSVAQDHRWRHGLKHRFWVARDDYLAVVVESVLFVFKDGQQIARFVDLQGVPIPHAVSERGLLYSFSKTEYGEEEWVFVTFDGRTTPLHIHSHLDDCWVTDQGIFCLDIMDRPTLIVIK